MSTRWQIAAIADFLSRYNAWRRGAEIGMPDPKALGEAIDLAVERIERIDRLEKENAMLREMEKVLRQIASMKRRTKEQRLASACIIFMDALREETNKEIAR